MGRTREIADVRRLIAASPLVTLTGPGGVCKTRLAIRVAEEARETFAQGSAFVPLAPVTDAEAVLPLVAQALGVREGGGREAADALEDHLRDKRLLLVLDNYEHMLPSEVDPAEQQASCRRLLLRVAHLLQRCHGLRVLVTSRAPLRVQGEQEYQVPRLRLPPADRLPTVAQIEQCEAVQLFAERARARRPDFALDEATAPPVAEICRRLDGLPLAIELAAARIRLLPPKAMLERLRLSFLSGGPVDGDARHRALRDTISTASWPSSSRAS